MIISDEHGEIIEQPQASEVVDRLVEPDDPRSDDFVKVKKWQSRIAVARKIRDEKLKDLNTLIDMYEGWQWGRGQPELRDRTTVNLIFANIKKELPHLYFKNPTPIVNATRGEFELQAFAMQELLKFYVNNNLGTELKKHVRLCILDAKFSFGCLKASYTPRFSSNPDKHKPIVVGYEQGVPIFQQDEKGNIVTGADSILTSELYSSERVSPREILIDAECRNFPEKASWIGQEIVKPLKYLQDSELYKNKKALKRNIELSEIFQLSKTTEETTAVRELTDDEDTQKVRFVEIYDFKNQELLVLPDNIPNFIRQESLYINPFSFLKFNESPDNFYPVSDVAQEKPLQEEINVGNSLMITHARRSARKYAYEEETFRGVDDVEGIEAMKNPEDLTMVKVTDLDKMPVPIGMAQQDPAIYQSLAQSRLNFNEVSSGTEAQSGFTQRRKTGKEAGFQEVHGAVRRTDKQVLVADFMVDTYSKLGKLMQETLSIPQAIKIIGDSGVFWTQVGKDDIKGDLFYNVEISDLRPQIPEMDRQELAEFVFSLSNLMNALAANPIMMQIFDVKGLISELAKSFPALNVSKILNGQITPEQISKMVMQQMEGQNGVQEQGQGGGE